MTPDPLCLRGETMRCEAREALKHHFIGNKALALYHVRQALSTANKLKNARARSALMRAMNIMRKRS